MHSSVQILTILLKLKPENLWRLSISQGDWWGQWQHIFQILFWAEEEEVKATGSVWGGAHLPLTQEVQSGPGTRTRRCSPAPQRKHRSPSPWQEGEGIKDRGVNCQKSSQLSLGCHPTHTKQTASCVQMQNPAPAQIHGISTKSTQTGLAGKGQAGNSFCVPRRCWSEVL